VLGAGALLLLLAALLGRSITGPLDRMVATMRAIGDGDLSRRLALGGGSELAELANGFNDMLSHVQGRDAELARHRASLEASIACRTTELQQSNRQLELELAERRLAEHAMRESRARMHALLDASGESVLLLAPEGRVLAINAFAAARFSQTPDTVMGRNFFDFMPPELASSRRAAVHQVALTGEPLHTHDQRGPIFFENHIYPVKDEFGAVESIAIYAKDVTQQQHAQRVDDIFRHLDTVLLKWRVNLESIAQMFCDDILPAFDLVGVWIGQAEKDGRIALRASAEVAGSGLLDQLREHGLRWTGAPPCCAPAADAIHHGQRRIVELDGEASAACGMAAHAIGARAVLILPLALRDQTWGVLTLYGRAPRQFNEPELAARLDTVAARLGVSLESAAQQEWLSLLDTALAAVDNAVLITDADAAILWANRSFGDLSGYNSEEVLGKTPKMFSSGVQDGDFYRRFWSTIRSGATWRGEIVNARRDGSHYTVNQTVTPLLNSNGQISHYVAILEDISARKLAEERIAYAASHDLLTGLPNRGAFFDRLEQALAQTHRDGQGGALLFLDLDRFKQVNDQLGPAAGDCLLIAVAPRLRALVRASDTVARLAGDEFTVILPHLAQQDDAAAIADKILAAIAQPLSIAGTELSIGISIGIALFPQNGATVEDILNAADNAMYAAKKAGRHGYAFAADVRAAGSPTSASGAIDAIAEGIAA
jgi:diguanylate cyclase (GGDEF)-like protein/PAS domain S-box-containing protein